MYALLQLRGTDPSISDFLQMPAKGGARTPQHFLSRMAGKPSGPAVELIEKSFMAASNSSSENIIFVMEDLPKGSLGNKSNREDEYQDTGAGYELSNTA